MGDLLSAVAADLSPTGSLRCSINLGNPVLAQGQASQPGGVTVDIARELSARLGVPLELVCFDAARESFEALKAGRADVGFLAIEPAREEEIAFTAPYVLIEGVYVVPRASPITSVGDVDSGAQVRIGVKEGSAYDLFLSRTLEQASIVRGDEGVDRLVRLGLEVGAGIRQPAAQFVVDHPEFRLIDEPFMQIRQAVATTRTRAAESVGWLGAVVEELKASGFIRAALDRSGQSDVAVAPG